MWKVHVAVRLRRSTSWVTGNVVAGESAVVQARSLGNAGDHMQTRDMRQCCAFLKEMSSSPLFNCNSSKVYMQAYMYM